MNDFIFELLYNKQSNKTKIMVLILNDIQKYFKVKEVDEDNIVCKLFYKVSFVLYVLGGILVATSHSQYVGKCCGLKTEKKQFC